MSKSSHHRSERLAKSAKQNESERGKHPKNGISGKLSSAHRTAPDSATQSAILQVAKLAHDQECHPREIWKEGVVPAITDYGGDGL